MIEHSRSISMRLFDSVEKKIDSFDATDVIHGPLWTKMYVRRVKIYKKMGGEDICLVFCAI